MVHHVWILGRTYHKANPKDELSLAQPPYASLQSEGELDFFDWSDQDS